MQHCDLHVAYVHAHFLYIVTLYIAYNPSGPLGYVISRVDLYCELFVCGRYSKREREGGGELKTND